MALLLLDLMAGGRIEGGALAAPPATPEAGLFYRVAASPSGAWIGHGGALAVLTAAGWRFIIPFEGLRLAEQSSGAEWVFSGGAWLEGKLKGSELAVDGVKVVGARAAAIASPGGGSVVDAESRAAISAILVALRQHGLIDT